ncbi:MAG: hypothetical protein CMJ18_14415 [Phycisphaeraceae bacterium]|nr:hypothetical protein [Phycisphaeraceae bacterium]
MISNDQLARFEEQGYVIIDSPFTDAELDRAEAAWDRLHDPPGRPPHNEPDFLDLFQHPFFEEVAKRMLRASTVYMWHGLIAQERMPSDPPHPEPGAEWKRGCHIDVQATWEGFTATPRRTKAEIWLWLNDAPANRGAMRYLPGSHRSVMQIWSRILTPEHKAMLPRGHGVAPQIAPETRWFPEHVPDGDGAPWVEREPAAMVARRGQALAFTSAGLHSAWHNEDTVPRKAMATGWIARGVRAGIPAHHYEGVFRNHAEMHKLLRPERAHIVPEHPDFFFESPYTDKWPEMFHPDHAVET